MQSYRLQLRICLEIQLFKHSVLYGVFACVTKTLVLQHLKYHIYTLKKARGLKLPTLTNWELVFHILFSIWFYLQPFSSYKLQKNPKITLGGIIQVCKVIGCNSEYVWRYSYSNILFYMVFLPV